LIRHRIQTLLASHLANLTSLIAIFMKQVPPWDFHKGKKMQYFFSL